MVDVSVIVPAFNQGRFLREAVESILSQSCGAAIEAIVIDDGSTDETPQVLAKIRDSRVRSFRTENRGAAAARNLGLAEARGRYLAFLDADDRWLPGNLDTQLAVLEAEPDVVFVFSDLRRFGPGAEVAASQFSFIPELDDVPVRPDRSGRGWVILGDPFEALLPQRAFPTWLQASVIRAERIRGMRFDPALDLSQDVDFMNQVYLRGPAAFTREIVAELRRHGDNITAEQLPTLEGFLAALLRTAANARLSDHQREVLMQRIGKATAGLGHLHFHERRPVASMRYYLRALRFPGTRRTALTHLAAMPLVGFLADPEGRLTGWH